jgi:hypothetical protein
MRGMSNQPTDTGRNHHPSSTVVEKAHRLLDQGRVQLETEPAAVLTVRGDTGTYRVLVGAHVQVCTCPASSRCSHIEAAVALITAKSPDAERWAAARAATHALELAEGEAVFKLLEAS